MFPTVSIPAIGSPQGQPSRSARYSEPTVDVLGEVRISGHEWVLTSQQLSLLSYLAVIGESGRGPMIEALWGGRAVSGGRFSNLISETRAKVGRHHLPESTNGRYRVEGITTDLCLFGSLARGVDSSVNALVEALQLVRGVPFTVPGSRYWMWPYATAGLFGSAEILITETALHLAEIALEMGDLARARWACEQGLLAAPLDEPLTILLTGVYLNLGKPAVAQRVVDEWEQRVERLGCGPPSTKVRQRLSGSRWGLAGR